MIKHFILIAWRNLKRRKILSLIQVLCLSIGLAAFILVARYVQYEKDWDKFNANYSRIFRAQTYRINDRLNDFFQIPVPVAAYLKANFPEVEESIVIREIWNEYFTSDKLNVVNERKGYWAPSEVFDVFSFKLIRGDKSTVLNQMNSIVLSQSMAKKYFSDSDPLGQVLYDRNRNELIVTGIVEDIPEQSHIEADYFRSNTWLLKEYGDNWYNHSYNTYVLLKPGISLEQFSYKIKEIIALHDPDVNRNLYLRPLSDLHLNESPRDDRGVVIYLFTFIGILILLLSCVSFMNLTTSFSTLRFTEIGIRKVMGSSRNQLRWQFLSEAVAVAFFSFMIAIYLAYLVLPVFNDVVNRNIDLQLFSNLKFLFFLLAVVLLTGLLAGFYPAFVTASFNPVLVLKNINPFRKGRISGLQGMVYFQFVLSVILITSSLWIYRQVVFLESKDVGFKNEALLNCALPASKATIAYESFRNEILAHNGIEDMSISLNSPMIMNWGCMVIPEGGDREHPIFSRWNIACHDFINTMSMQLAQGRNFSKNFSIDSTCCLINETAAKAYGWEDPIGMTLEMEGRYKVIGVIKDFNIEDVHNPILPYVLLFREGNFAKDNDLNFKVRAGQQQSALAHINSTMQNYFSDVLFSVNAYETNSNRIELKIWASAKNTIAFFTIFAVVIASIGLFGLVFFASQRRIKEIGIRKVQGARITQLISIIMRRYLLLAVSANVIVYPVALVVQQILPGEYKYQFNLWDVLLVFGITMLVTVLSGVFQVAKAAFHNPVEALRYE